MPVSLAFSPFVMVAVIVAIAVTAKLIKDLYEMRLEHHSNSREVVKSIESLASKIEKLERRMSNIESIVIEREKEHSFERELHTENH